LKISAIVPVYNSEPYIDRCIKSILSQTHYDWEVIIVDDGSTDNSLEITMNYAHSEERIKVFHQDNLGAGMARNLGLDKVDGDYTVFIDSDDYVEPNYFELLSHHFEDIVFIDVNRRNSIGTITKIERMSINRNKSKDDVIRGQMTGKIPWGAVRKAAKTDLLRRYCIKFSNDKIGEEAIYSFLLLHFSKSIAYIDIPVYNYVVHSGSLSQIIYDDPWGEVSTSIKSKIKELGLYEKYADTINSFIFTATVISLSRLAIKHDKQCYRCKANERINLMVSSIDHYYTIDRKHINIIALCLKPLIDWRMVCVIRSVAILKELMRQGFSNVAFHKRKIPRTDDYGV